MAYYHKTELTDKGILRQKARAIAKALRWYFPLEQTAYRSFHITNGKNIINIGWGAGTGNGRTVHIWAEGLRTGINCNARRTPQSIAGDIKARLYPEARKELLEERQRTEEHKERGLSKLNEAIRLSKIAGVKFRKGKYFRHYLGDTKFNITDRAEIEVDTCETYQSKDFHLECNMKLCVSPEIAEKIIRVLMTR
jgi:hypothetical protein